MNLQMCGRHFLHRLGNAAYHLDIISYFGLETPLAAVTSILVLLSVRLLSF